MRKEEEEEKKSWRVLERETGDGSSFLDDLLLGRGRTCLESISVDLEHVVVRHLELDHVLCTDLGFEERKKKKKSEKGWQRRGE